MVGVRVTSSVTKSYLVGSGQWGPCDRLKVKIPLQLHIWISNLWEQLLAYLPRCMQLR
jgi:hypothetical protein